MGGSGWQAPPWCQTLVSESSQQTKKWATSVPGAPEETEAQGGRVVPQPSQSLWEGEGGEGRVRGLDLRLGTSTCLALTCLHGWTEDGGWSEGRRPQSSLHPVKPRVCPLQVTVPRGPSLSA